MLLRQKKKTNVAVSNLSIEGHHIGRSTTPIWSGRVGMSGHKDIICFRKLQLMPTEGFGKTRQTQLM